MLKKLLTLTAARQLGSFDVERLAAEAEVAPATVRTVLSRCPPDWFTYSTEGNGLRGGQWRQYELTAEGKAGIDAELGRVSQVSAASEQRTLEASISSKLPTGLGAARVRLARLANLQSTSPESIPVLQAQLKNNLLWAKHELESNPLTVESIQLMDEVRSIWAQAGLSEHAEEAGGVDFLPPLASSPALPRMHATPPFASALPKQHYDLQVGGWLADSSVCWSSHLDQVYHSQANYYGSPTRRMAVCRVEDDDLGPLSIGDFVVQVLEAVNLVERSHENMASLVVIDDFDALFELTSKLSEVTLLVCTNSKNSAAETGLKSFFSKFRSVHAQMPIHTVVLDGSDSYEVCRAAEHFKAGYQANVTRTAKVWVDRALRTTHTVKFSTPGMPQLGYSDH